jgi:hypothetical protein
VNKKQAVIAYELKFDTGEEIIKDTLANQVQQLGSKKIAELFQNLENKLAKESRQRNEKMAPSSSEVLPRNHYFYYSKAYEQYRLQCEGQGDEALIFLQWVEMQRLEDSDFQAWLADDQLPTHTDFNSLQLLKDDIPNPIKFDGWISLFWWPIDLWYVFTDWALDRQGIVHYIYNEQRWPIMSERMLHHLRQLGDFQHQSYPIEIADFTLAHASTTARTGRVCTSYSIVQTLENLDIFDWEKSQYVEHIALENRIQSATKVVLKKPADALPPLFRISAYPSKLFVSAAVVQQIESETYSHIQYTGARFTPIDENYQLF